MQITELPFNAFIGLSESEREGFVLSLPNDRRYANHVGSVHASALLALAEATSGHCIIALSRKLNFDIVPLVRRLDSKFRKPAIGSVHARHSVERSKEETFLEQLKSKGKSIISIQVDVYDENGTLALSAVVDWFVSRK